MHDEESPALTISVYGPSKYEPFITGYCECKVFKIHINSIFALSLLVSARISYKVKRQDSLIAIFIFVGETHNEPRNPLFCNDGELRARQTFIRSRQTAAYVCCCRWGKRTYAYLITQLEWLN